MRTISTNFLLNLFILIFSTAAAENPVALRAAIDVGMGGPKLQIAEVDLKTNKIVKVLHTQRYFVNFYEGCINQQLSSEIMTQGLEAFKNAIKTAYSFNANDIVAIATASFRSALNGLEFADTIQKQTGVKVHVVDQNLEGKLAFRAALSKVDANYENVIVWDIGGGSIQFISQEEDSSYLVDCGKEGVGAFNDYIIGTIQCHDIKECKTPNPMSSTDIIKAITYARDQSQKINKIIKDKLNNSAAKVIGVGNAFGYGIASMVGKDAFYIDEIKNVASNLVGKTDADLGGGEYAFCEGSNVLLAYGFMQGLGIDNIQILHINNADGAMVYEPFWEQP